MASKYAETAPYAALLGTLFYQDPDDAATSDALAFFADENAADQWPYGGSAAQAHINAMGASVASDPVFSSEAAEPSEEETMHEAYARLMIGPNKLPAPPWGSVYTDHDSVIFGNKTLDVRAWMRDNGVRMELDSYVPEDHIGLLLIMFSWAVRNGVPDEALTVFLQEHLLSWSPRFLDLFVQGAQHPFYASLGALAQATFADWVGRFELEPAQVKMYR